MTLYLLDSTVLIDHLRADVEVTDWLRARLAHADRLGTSCVNVAEVERGVARRDRPRLEQLIERLAYLPTTREAAARAGRYQADWARRGRTIHTADALVAGTARVHGAVLVTDNVEDFPMRDVKVQRPPRSGS
jgi:predicted nucleic acid-binding protein